MIHVLRHILTLGLPLGLILGLLAGCGAVAATAGPSKPCGLETGSSHSVARVIDGETILLDDGREVRLMGALAPKADGPRGAPDWPPAEAARQALEALIGPRSVELRTQGRRRDRYGRELAQVFVVAEGADAVWLQEALVRDGQARAYALPGNAGCLRELAAAEAEARQARRGLWSRDTYRVRVASDVSGLLRLAGKFVLVEGKVAAVARTAKMIYINFGADWRHDFTASMALSSLDQTTGDAVGDAARLQGLAGRKVRVRGWIERRNGPLIGLSTVAEIEVLDAAPASLAGEAGNTGAAAIPPATNETAPR